MFSIILLCCCVTLLNAQNISSHQNETETTLPKPIVNSEPQIENYHIKTTHDTEKFNGRNPEQIYFTIPNNLYNENPKDIQRRFDEPLQYLQPRSDFGQNINNILDQYEKPKNDFQNLVKSYKITPKRKTTPKQITSLPQNQFNGYNYYIPYQYLYNQPYLGNTDYQNWINSFIFGANYQPYSQQLTPYSYQQPGITDDHFVYPILQNQPYQQVNGLFTPNQIQLNQFTMDNQYPKQQQQKYGNIVYPNWQGSSELTKIEQSQPVYSQEYIGSSSYEIPTNMFEPSYQKLPQNQLTENRRRHFETTDHIVYPIQQNQLNKQVNSQLTPTQKPLTKIEPTQAVHHQQDKNSIIQKFQSVLDRKVENEKLTQNQSKYVNHTENGQLSQQNKNQHYIGSSSYLIPMNKFESNNQKLPQKQLTEYRRQHFENTDHIVYPIQQNQLNKQVNSQLTPTQKPLTKIEPTQAVHNQQDKTPIIQKFQPIFDSMEEKGKLTQNEPKYVNHIKNSQLSNIQELQSKYTSQEKNDQKIQNQHLQTVYTSDKENNQITQNQEFQSEYTTEKDTDSITQTYKIQSVYTSIEDNDSITQNPQLQSVYTSMEDNDSITQNPQLHSIYTSQEEYDELSTQNYVYDVLSYEITSEEDNDPKSPNQQFQPIYIKTENPNQDILPVYTNKKENDHVSQKQQPLAAEYSSKEKNDSITQNQQNKPIFTSNEDRVSLTQNQKLQIIYTSKEMNDQQDQNQQHVSINSNTEVKYTVTENQQRQPLYTSNEQNNSITRPIYTSEEEYHSITQNQQHKPIDISMEENNHNLELPFTKPGQDQLISNQQYETVNITQPTSIHLVKNHRRNFKTDEKQQVDNLKLMKILDFYNNSVIKTKQEHNNNNNDKPQEFYEIYLKQADGTWINPEDEIEETNLKSSEESLEDDRVRPKLIPEYSTTRRSSNSDESHMITPDIIQKYGYPGETYSVTTEDGYILKMHRIPWGIRSPACHYRKKPVVFLMHDIISSSSDFIINGPDQSLAYILADAGYDVWMGNARGNRYSRNHISLVPSDNKFWDFTWHEIGYYDVPVMIDFALNMTEQPKLYYIGHSQGTTVYYVMTSERPEYNDKIIASFHLAPIAYLTHMISPLLRFFAIFANQIGLFFDIIGVGEFLPKYDLLTQLGHTFCKERDFTQFLCTSPLFILSGYNKQNLNETRLPLYMGHTPAGGSTKQFIHYGQIVNSGVFRQFNLGPANLLKYGSLYAPSYDLNKCTAPIVLIYSLNGFFSRKTDVDYLYRKLPNVKMLEIEDPQFGHIDFLFGMNARKVLYDDLLKMMQNY